MMLELLLLAALVWALFSRGGNARFTMHGGLARQTPEQKLSAIVRFMQQQNLTLEQLADTWQKQANEPPAQPRFSSQLILSRISLLLGAVFVIAGVCVFIQGFWDSMGSLGRIFLTYGVGLGLSFFSVHMMRKDKSEFSVLPFIILAAVFEVGGLGVVLHEFFPASNDPRKAALFCLGLMALKQAVVFHSFRHDALLFTAIVFLYGALDALLDLGGIKQEYIAILLGGSLFFTAHIVNRTPHDILSAPFYLFAAIWFGGGLFVSLQDYTSIQTALLVVGASYFLLAHSLEKHKYESLAVIGYAIAALVMASGIYMSLESSYSPALAGTISGLSLCSVGFGFYKARRHDALIGLLWFIGSASFFCSLFDLMRHTPFEVVYLAVGIYVVYASTLLHSRALMLTSVLAILGFIGYYTQEHFLHSVGWPVALMIMGIIFLAVGSAAVRIKRKFNM